MAEAEAAMSAMTNQVLVSQNAAKATELALARLQGRHQLLQELAAESSTEEDKA
jgi:hypothetical protein